MTIGPVRTRASSPPIDSGTIRRALSAHPVAIECSRAATELTTGIAEVIVFEDGRAFVAASCHTDVLRPRRLTEVEAALVASSDPMVRIGTKAAFALVDPSGAVVGSLSVDGELSSKEEKAIQAIARSVSTLIPESAIASSAEINVAVVQRLRDAVLVINPAFEILWANQAVGTLFGRTTAEMIGRSAADFVHPDDIETALEALWRMQQGLETYRVEVRVSSADGEYMAVEATGTDCTSDPAINGHVLSLRSVAGDREVKFSVERNQLISEAIVASLDDGIIATDEFGAVTMVNHVARSMFGIEPHAAIASLALSDFDVRDLAGNPHRLGAIPATPRGTRFTTNEPDSEVFELLIASPDGQVRFIAVRRQVLLSSESEPLGSVIILRDTTASHAAAEELRSQALHDHLTGLPNRRQLQNVLADLALGQAIIPVAASFVDLDWFKLVNDTHGHKTGDEVIRITAERLRNELDDAKMLFRLGGDEFVALHVGSVDVANAMATADRLREALTLPYSINNERFDLTASVGVAVLRSENPADGTLLQNADIALYAAKLKGRNVAVEFDDDLADVVMLEERQRRVVRLALEDDRLVMHFQPMVNAQTNAVTGYEALARIKDENGELMGPDSFITALGSSGLLWDLDRQAFALSCQAAVEVAALSPDNPPTVACNFASTSIGQSTFVEVVVDTVTRFGVSPSQICLEITESAAFEAGPTTLSGLVDLRAMGFKIALDDFGTGYSSLAHLRDLPITSVKVDQSFIAKLTEASPERAISKAIVSLAEELNLVVVAEGVETPQQLKSARRLGFDTIQGWIFSAAKDLSEILGTAT